MMNLRAEHKKHVNRATENKVRPMRYTEFIQFRAGYYSDIVRWLEKDIEDTKKAIEMWREEAEKWEAKPSPFNDYMAEGRRKAIKKHQKEILEKEKSLEAYEKILPAYRDEAERLEVG